MQKNRRIFLKLMAQAMTYLVIAGKVKGSTLKKNINYFVSCTSEKAGYGQAALVVRTPPSEVLILNTANSKIKKIGLDFFGHIVSSYSADADKLFVFEQYGTRGAVLDFKKQKLQNYISAEPNTTFMGHCEFLNSENLIITTEFDHKLQKGQIAIRNSADQKINKIVFTEGKFPHDCCMDPDTGHLIVINAGQPSNVVFIDLKKFQVVKKINLLDGDKGFYSHFARSEDGYLFCVARRGEGRPNLIDPKGEMVVFENPNVGQNGILSVKFIKNNPFVMCCLPEANMVRVWNYKTKKIAQDFNIESARGIIESKLEDGSYEYFVTSEGASGLVKIIFKGEIISKVDADVNFKTNGSHSSFFKKA